MVGRKIALADGYTTYKVSTFPLRAQQVKQNFILQHAFQCARDWLC